MHASSIIDPHNAADWLIKQYNKDYWCIVLFYVCIIFWLIITVELSAIGGDSYAVTNCNTAFKLHFYPRTDNGKFHTDELRSVVDIFLKNPLLCFFPP
jgi:hypothetical protein